jgi:hypothetical protein
VDLQCIRKGPGTLSRQLSAHDRVMCGPATVQDLDKLNFGTFVDR